MILLPYALTSILAMISSAEGSPASQTSPTPNLPAPFVGIPNLEIKYYDVAGTDPKSINAALSEAGPRHEGELAQGRTDYRFAPTWQEFHLGGDCRVTHVDVQFSVVVLLPRLTQAASISASLLDGWQKSFAVLERHEAGHARIAFEHLDDFKAALKASRCGEEQPAAQAVLEHIEELQLDYDRRTQNGRAQGDISH